jgi:hypothetical protein
MKSPRGFFSDASEVCGDLKMREVAYLDTGTRSWNGCHTFVFFVADFSFLNTRFFHHKCIFKNGFILLSNQD